MLKRASRIFFPTRVVLGCGMLVIALLASPAPAAERLDESTVRAMVRQLDAAAVARDIAPWEARLAPECDVAMQVTVFGTLKTQHFSRREYLDLAAASWDQIAKYQIGHNYAAGSPTIRLESGGKTAVVTQRSTETLRYPDGRELVTSSLSTMRIEARGERLLIVSINVVAGD